MAMPRFCFDRDESGHWYMIRADRRPRFRELAKLIDSDDATPEIRKEWDDVFAPHMLSGVVQRVTFTDPRED